MISLFLNNGDTVNIQHYLNAQGAVSFSGGSPHAEAIAGQAVWEVVNDTSKAITLRSGPTAPIPTLQLLPAQPVSILLSCTTKHSFLLRSGLKSARVTYVTTFLHQKMSHSDTKLSSITKPQGYCRLYLSSIFPHRIPDAVKFTIDVDGQFQGGEPTGPVIVPVRDAGDSYV